MAANKKATAKKSNLPAVRESVELQDQELMELLLQEQMEGVKVTFPGIKIIHAGALQFDFGNGEREKEFEGVIMFRHPANADWKEKYNGTATPPDCSSFDGVVGKGDPGGSCADCPLNQFGSADEGKGKHCKNTERFFILMNPTDEIPYAMEIPPTSLGQVATYVARCTSNRVAIPTTFTKFSLKPGSGGGYEYSKLVLSKGDFLEDDEITRVLHLRKDLMKAMRTKELEQDDFETGKQSGGRDDNWTPPSDDDTAKPKAKAGAKGSARRKTKI